MAGFKPALFSNDDPGVQVKNLPLQKMKHPASTTPSSTGWGGRVKRNEPKFCVNYIARRLMFASASWCQRKAVVKGAEQNDY